MSTSGLSTQGVCILGSTGTIGVNTLDVIKRHPEKYNVVALTANQADEKLYQQCVEFKPEYAVLVNADAAQRLKEKIDKAGLNTEVLSGVESLEKVAGLDNVHQVMAAIVGAAGLLPTLAAARAGKRILLANKEALVMSGDIFIKEVEKHQAELLPIDSEHNAIFQCMPSHFEKGLEAAGVNKILLTASGGPFRTRSIDTLHDVTPEEAVAHPNWVMGQKISVDSATMMNKGLEVIEACWLFNTKPEMIQVVLHSQSIIHSMVSYTDGSVLAQMGNPDMRTPIAHAMAWPERIPSGVEPLDIFDVAKLEFEKPDFKRFPCLAMAYEALNEGGTSTTILNAANEIAVDAFLNKKLSFTNISRVIEKTLENITKIDADNLQIILQADSDARQVSEDWVKQLEFKR
ncbi:MAG: 1-deoxy-D-xylulose-5-phosphate reductoisomerase [endosymbiont of Galathealinum brachiosum]|uniref:1-deoxy-D-xylulose 5-phosphate reductoisomerase n=1 Tax=endosymbiont of Galathealinum brachiosum TaxID=2200906 RepID=A0A370DK25_9GAMM|nr:MAG: 1-deoxy-D-xylulose-5-phosphate reductoisomerase [endosymbiont of Galathealinum brachiosum]